jgi:precorrin-6B methylase 2
MSAPEISTWIRELASDDEKVAGSARRRLVARGNIAVAELHAVIKTPQNILQYRAALRTLGEIAEAGNLQDKPVTRALVLDHLITHHDAERRSLITCLGHLGLDAQAEAALIDLWKNEKRDDQLRVLAAALGRVGSADSQPYLKACASSAPLVQREVARALSAISSRHMRAHSGEGRIDGDKILTDTKVRLRCRTGLTDVLLTNLPTTIQNPHVCAPGQIDADLNGALNSLFECRLWSDAVLCVPNAGVNAEQFAIALAGSAGVLLRNLTVGAPTWRLNLPNASRGQLLDYVRAAQRAVPDLPNSPERAVWELRPNHTDLEIVPRFWPDPRFKYLRATIPGMTHPPLAAALAALSEPRVDDVVWDPFCGTGTELAERAKAGPYAKLIGSDRDATAIAAARQNLQGIERLELHIGDALKLKLANVTVLLTNPPYGRKVQGGNTANLLHDLFEHATKLMPRGRIVICSPMPQQTWQWASKLGWKGVARHSVGTEGHLLEAQVFVRT